MHITREYQHLKKDDTNTLQILTSNAFLKVTSDLVF